jgi:tetratricopeptide (TPR) repeat protein
MPSLPIPSSPAQKHRLIKVSFALALLLAGSLIYLPGLSGPFLLDDMQNIVKNHFVHLSSLGFDHLYTAAFSTAAGPLKRPVAMLSFALNYYAIGGVNDPTTFKATNVAIHAINGLLVYWLCYLIFLRLSTTNETTPRPDPNSNRKLHVAAASAALFWVVHPIQLTSVLYVVQRMTSLCAMFTLLGLIGYMAGRLRMERGEPNGLLLMIVGIVLGGVLASFSKETGFLLPLYALVLEATLFRTARPWSGWHSLSVGHRRTIGAALLVLGSIAVIWVVHYASQNYGLRPFTPLERALTETRVLWLYLSLIVVPGLDRFGFNHDDIAISTSLLHPWTTLPAVIGIAALLGTGLLLRKRQPLMALGILWFFVGHALESTVFALEIAHEHRNYLPSLGIVLVGVQFIRTRAASHGGWRPWLATVMIGLLLATVTVLRSSEWSNMYDFSFYEAEHHPDSARSQAYLGQALIRIGQFEGGAAAYRRAAELDPSEPAYLMALIQVPTSMSGSPSPSEQKETIRRLEARKITPGAMLVLQTLNGCVLQKCAYARTTTEKWARVLLAADIPGQDNSFYYHLLGRSLMSQGRNKEALQALVRSYTLDPKYLYPRIDAVKLLLSEGQLHRAEHEMSQLIVANKDNRFPQDEEVAALSALFDDLRQRKVIPN